jgi:excisionase family DNA binding protein
MTLEKVKRYVTVQDAVELLNVSERTVRRMMDEKRLYFIKDRTGHCRIDLDDIEKEQQAKPHTVSPLRHQVQETQNLVKELQEAIQEQKHQSEQQDHRIEQLEQEVAALHQQVSQEVPIIQLPPQEGAFSLTEIAQLVAKQLTGISRLPAQQGLTGILAKRNLSDGTMRLVDFAKVHHIDSVHAIKKGYYEGALALTIHQREGTVKRNHQEWWISEAQHQPVIAYCQAHAIPYVPCPQCQDQDETDVQVG